MSVWQAHQSARERHGKIRSRAVRGLGDAGLAHLDEAVNAAAKLKIHVRNDLAVDFDRLLADEPARLAFGLALSSVSELRYLPNLVDGTRISVSCT